MTPETDGALDSESISFKLLDGDNLYIVEFPQEISYTLNIIAVLECLQKL